MTKQRFWFWSGSWPAKCDLCKTDLSKRSVFYDAQLIDGGWALLCNKCFYDNTYGRLGVGWGQKYDSKTLLKLEG